MHDLSYEDFCRLKHEHKPPTGITCPPELGAYLFPFQADLVRWALRRGRAAIFASTGLGKSRMQLEWARVVSEHTGRPVLVLAPLAVAQQTVREGESIGIAVTHRRDGDASGGGIIVTNYEMADHFEPADFAGIVLDESSILKSYTGATRNMLIDRFAATPFKLACTATPAPNDYTELGNHSEFLGIKSRLEMMAEYFVHDGGSTQDWMLKGHAVDAFWRWVCSWGAMVTRPSDLGYEDGGYALPPLRMHERVIGVDHMAARVHGYLFAPEATTLADQRATRRITMADRVKVAAEIANGEGPCLVWCELNDEADACAAAIDGAVQVAGSDSPDDKADRMLGFAAGNIRVLVSKASICGFGMNFQGCSRMVFVGASHSYEQVYQAIRRCWRFGQKKPVDVYVIRAETEGAIVENFRRKEADAERMMAEATSHVLNTLRAEVRGATKEWGGYDPQKAMTIPSWVKEEQS